MGGESNRNEMALQQAATAPPDCPLNAREQTRNLVIFGVNQGLIYLAAPVLYIGITQGALLKRLNASNTISNLPSTVYFWATPLPIVVAWYFCSFRVLKPVLVTTYLLVAAAGAFVVVTLLLPTPEWVYDLPVDVNQWLPTEFAFPPHWVILAIFLHAALLGCALGVVAAYQWEVLGKGVTEKRRGQALALAFGVGPILAFLSSLVSQLVLAGKIDLPIMRFPLKFSMRTIAIPEIEYPWNFAFLFGGTIPIMGLAAFLSTKFIVPRPSFDVKRPPFIEGVFGGFGDFFSYRLILLAGVATILVSSGYNALTNMSLFTTEAIGEQAEKYAGYQNALRFGCKAAAGLVLGWLLTKTNAKVGMLVTGAFCLASVVWVLTVPGIWFLLCFGLMGVGELFGVYYPNYILCCSAKAQMRRNMAFFSMLYMPSSFAPLLFGLIADKVGAASGNMLFGFQMSFLTAVAFLVAALLLVLIALPSQPRPRLPDLDVEGKVLTIPARETAAPASP
jgi:MFS family permease